ncbi:MAG: NTP/NDP exchange transporter [Rickettsia sp.]|nr:NTP/NDP exchange transporter [Rickettsia sp.]
MQINNFLINLKNFFWPIKAKESRVFITMALMMLFILLNYATLRSIKDAFIINSIAPEALSFLKLYVVLPLAIVTLIIYTKLCNIFSPDNVFYIMGSFFLIYFVAFTFLMYPKAEYIHLSPEKVTILVAQYPFLQWFIKIVANWSYSLFYAFSELWGSVMLSLLFWQFANRITTTKQAKRFYPMFGLIGNMGPLTLPLILSLLNESVNIVPKNIKYIPVFCFIILFNIIVLLLYRYIIYSIDTTNFLEKDSDDKVTKKTKSKKLKLSIVDSFKLILTSKYLGMMVILVVSYGISINLVEGIWKAHLSKVYNSQESYTQFMGNFQALQSSVSIVFMLIGSYILRNVSWKIAAILTPLVILCTGGMFLSLVIFEKYIGNFFAGFLGISTLSLALFFGTLQNVLSKSTKYSLFDSTKEMAYIPLSPELKSKGKAAVDVLGGRLGKSGGGLIQSTIFLFPGFNFTTAAPIFALIFFLILIIWLFAINEIDTEYQKKISN